MPALAEAGPWARPTGGRGTHRAHPPHSSTHRVTSTIRVAHGMLTTGGDTTEGSPWYACTARGEGGRGATSGTCERATQGGGLPRACACPVAAPPACVPCTWANNLHRGRCTCAVGAAAAKRTVGQGGSGDCGPQPTLKRSSFHADGASLTALLPSLPSFPGIKQLRNQAHGADERTPPSHGQHGTQHDT